VWKEVKLKGDTSAEFDQQITALESFLGENWRTTASPKTGNPVYERPVALVIYREDCEFLLHTVVPTQETVQADYDLVIASQPYRARASVEFKARRVIAPLAKGLRPGGRLIGIQSCGDDPALEIIQKVWPEEDPFRHDRHMLLAETKKAAEALINAFMGIGSDFLVQEFIREAGGSDIRCFVVGKNVIAAMQRKAVKGEYRSNLHRGGTAEVDVAGRL